MPLIYITVSCIYGALGLAFLILSLKRRKPKWIDVTKPPYNADPTGKEDIWPVLVRASEDVRDDGTLYLPAGRYRCEGGLVALSQNKSVKIVGAGKESTIIMGSL